MEILLLSTSAQHSAGNTDVITDPKVLKKWIDSLPIMDLPTTVKKLHTAIESINELVMDDRQRIKLLEIYYDSLQDILISYDEIRISMLQIETQQRNLLREDIMWLYLSLANGYKYIVKNAYDKGASPKKDSAFLQAIYTAMELIIEGLLYGYRSHQTPPPLARLEINQLYSLALYKNVGDTQVKGIKGHLQTPTISRLFKQYALLSISNPYRLSSSDILELFLFLESVVDECIIESNGSINPPDGKYLIDLNADTSPASAYFLENPEEVNGKLIIDVWPIVNTLGLRLAKQDQMEESFAQAQERHMIDILIEQLGQQNKRRSAREELDIDTQLAIGMDAVHFYLLAHLKGKKAWPTTGEDPAYPLTQWKIRNCSDGGYMLEIPQQNITTELLVGEILALSLKTEKQTPVPIKLAIIRWIQREQDEMIQIGIEALSDGALPITYMIESEFGLQVDDGMNLSGIYFPPDHQKSQPASILIDKVEYKNNQSITLINGNRKHDILITALLLDSPLYVRLKFKKKPA